MEELGEAFKKPLLCHNKTGANQDGTPLPTQSRSSLSGVHQGVISILLPMD